MVSVEEYDKECARIDKAIDFAVKKHSAVVAKDGSMGQKRKGSNLPYIIHPLEVWMILRDNNCSVDVQIAGLLHDTIEDAGVTPNEIERVFGKRILELVEEESEDKTKTWKERKQATIDFLFANPQDIEGLCITCADKLSNCRAQLYDYSQIGERLFDRFNKQSSAKLQGWYYRSIVEALKPLEGMRMYEELKEIVEKLYSNFD